MNSQRIPIYSTEIPPELQSLLEEPVETICPICHDTPPTCLFGGIRYKWMYLHIRDNHKGEIK